MDGEIINNPDEQNIEPDVETGVLQAENDIGTVRVRVAINDSDNENAEQNIDEIFEMGVDNSSNKVSCVNLSEDNVVTTGHRQRQPRKRDPADGYELTTIDQDMDKFLMAQTSYIRSMETISQVDEAVGSAINHILLTQRGMKKSITFFGEAGVRSIYKEVKQFHDREVVRFLKPQDIAQEIRHKALAYLMF